MRSNIFPLCIFWLLIVVSSVSTAQDSATEAPVSASSEEATAQETATQQNNEKPKTQNKKDASDIRNRQVTGPLKQSETIDLSDTIVGNQEQPTVLYIVPWKDAQDTTILYLPLSSKALEELFGHIDRVEHQRQVQFIEKLDD